MEDTNNQITQIYRSTFANIFGLPSKEAILSMALAGLLPRKCLTFLHDHLLGSQCLEGLHSLNKATNQVMRQLVREKAEEIGQGKGNKDTISLLVKANLSENEQLKISDNKLIAHMSTIFIAEHETTANSLFWTLLELSQHSEVQKWLRDEIWMKEQEVASRGNTTGMLLYLDAVVKESLCYHTVAIYINHIATANNIILLSKLILMSDGQYPSEIPVKKGQDVVVSLCSYNRNKSIFEECPYAKQSAHSHAHCYMEEKKQGALNSKKADSSQPANSISAGTKKLKWATQGTLDGVVNVPMMEAQKNRADIKLLCYIIHLNSAFKNAKN
ncbi:cytochrome p450 [Moniliophthora roreri]|nr:cytochrome p450 [Moniliophthora roreri]